LVNSTLLFSRLAARKNLAVKGNEK